MYEYGLIGVRIVDGDTIEATVDLGFRISREDSYRLKGINAPEKNTVAGKDAIAYATTWFHDHAGPYVVKTDKDKKEKYGRYLAAIVAADGHDLATDLIANGHAVPWDGHGPRPT